jgi:hypothetical protein
VGADGIELHVRKYGNQVISACTQVNNIQLPNNFHI